MYLYGKEHELMDLHFNQPVVEKKSTVDEDIAKWIKNKVDEKKTDGISTD